MFIFITLLCLLMICSVMAMAAAADQPTSRFDQLSRIPDTRYEFQGIMEEYISAVTKNWLMIMPDKNPAILQMFADREKNPPLNLLPWSGEFAGKYLTGGTQILRLTHDPELKNRLSQFVAKLVQLQAEDGYFGPYAKERRLYSGWDVWGHYHVMLGLLLWHEETGDQQALECAEKIGDFLCRNFLHGGRRIVDLGSVEMNHAAIHSLCLLYKITKKPAYLELARQIADEEFQDARAGDYLRNALAGREFYQGPKPRWESLHSIQGLVELYRITGKEDYRKAFEQIWWSIVKLDRHNNGGFSSGEQARGNPYDPRAIETCSTVAWIAMSVDMLRLTGDSVVADELELSTLNQVLGYQNRSGNWCTYNTPMDGTRVRSTTDVAFQIRPASEQVNCCSANAPRGLGLMADWALMTDGTGLVLNWYGPATLGAKLKGAEVSIKEETEYPRDGRIVLSLSLNHSLRFPLKLRIPHWSAKTMVQVNGLPVQDVTPGTYLTLDREWKTGDTVEVDLDMSPHFWAGERECAGKTSVYRGPLLLVYELASPGAKPGHQLDVRLSSGWDHSENHYTTKEPGSFMEFDFEGTFVYWKGPFSDEAGKALVTLDGNKIGVVDEYAPKNAPWRRDIQYYELRPGKHTMRITLLDEKNPDSKDHCFSVGNITVPDNYTGPVFDATRMDGRILPGEGAKPPLLMMEYLSADGKPVRLRDFATAGENSDYYYSWLEVKNVLPTDFSRKNPLRSSPAAQR